MQARHGDAVSEQGSRSRRHRFLAAGAVALLTASGLGIALAASSPAATPNGGYSGLEAALPAGAAGNPKADIVSVSCPTGTICVGVGSYVDASGQSTGVLEGLNNGVWTLDPAPLPADAATGASAQSALESISCTSLTSCLAVGEYTNSAGGQSGLLEDFIDSATTFVAVAAPVPTDAALKTGTDEPVNANVLGVSCPTAAFCEGVGEYQSDPTKAGGVGGEVPLTETMTVNNGSPQIVGFIAPVPVNTSRAAGVDDALTTISCTSATTCAAGGTAAVSGGGYEGFLDTLNGSTTNGWTALAAPVPANAAAATSNALPLITQVNCVDATDCAASGGYYDASGDLLGVIDTLSGTTWTATQAQEPTNAGTGTKLRSYLTGVGCGSAATCVATGAYEDANGQDDALFNILTNGAYAAAAAPLPGVTTGTGAGSLLDAVSCSAPGVCTAVGTYKDANGANQGLIDSLSGLNAMTVEASLPANASSSPAAFLGSVSCVSGQCTAGGSYTDSAGNVQGLLESTTTTTTTTSTTTTTLATSTTTTAPVNTSSTTTTTQPVVSPSSPTGSYYEVTSNGETFGFGANVYQPGSQVLTGPVVGMAAAPNGGYYEVTSNGQVLYYNAPNDGSMAGQRLNSPIVGMAYNTAGTGYYLVAADGGVFCFGGAPYLGSMGGKPLNSPIVGIAVDPVSGGYYLVAGDGGIFAFGGAPFLGSMGGQHLNEPVVGMTVDTLTGGYYLVASDGGLFAYHAPFLGSEGGQPLVKPVVGMAFDPNSGGGYYLVASDGGLFAFNAPFAGSAAAMAHSAPVVGMAVS